MDSIERYLQECVRIEPLCIEEEFVRVPSDIAYWNDRYATVYQVWLESKLRREILYGQLYNEKRQALVLSGVARPTVDSVESEVMQDPHYQQARMDEIRAEAEKVRLSGVMDALRAKRDMVVSIGAHIRAELARDPVVRTQGDEALRREVDTQGGFGRR